MQLFVRCGTPLGTLSLDCLPTETVQDVKGKLGRASRRLHETGLLNLFFGGRILRNDMQLQAVQGLQPWSTLQLTFRLRGAGGDGGATGAESRSSYLEMYLEKKPDKVNPAEELLAKWTTCHLSNEKLRLPCVVDELGFIYNKEAVLNHLLNKTMPAQLSYLSLKHVTEVKLAPASSSTADSKNGGKAASQATFQSTNECDFACPVSGLPFNGRYKFVVIKPSGLAVSEKALKEAKAVVEDLAGGEWTDDDVVAINPPADLLEQLKVKVAARLAAEREKKAARKRDKAASSVAAPNDTAGAIASNRDSAGKRSASPPAALVPDAKKAKLLETMPAGATKEVYTSLFTTGKEKVKETFACRALSARGMNLT